MQQGVTKITQAGAQVYGVVVVGRNIEKISSFSRKCLVIGEEPSVRAQDAILEILQENIFNMKAVKCLNRILVDLKPTSLEIYKA